MKKKPVRKRKALAKRKASGNFRVSIGAGEVTKPVSPQARHKYIGIGIPINFRTTKMTRRQRPKRPGDFVRAPRPVSGSMQVYFSWLEIPFEGKDLLEPGSHLKKQGDFYRRYNAYGEHEFLVPALVREIERGEWPFSSMPTKAMHFYFDLVNEDPTTAVMRQTLQLIPCSRANLALFREKLQTQPFYIEICGDENSPDQTKFWLHLRRADGSYLRVPSRSYCPTLWPYVGHASIGLETATGTVPVEALERIDWTQLAEDLLEARNTEVASQPSTKHRRTTSSAVERNNELN